MNTLKWISIGLVSLLILVGDISLSQAGGRSRKFGADAGLTEGKRKTAVQPTATLKDEGNKKGSSDEKLKPHVPASKSKACSQRSLQRSRSACGSKK